MKAKKTKKVHSKYFDIPPFTVPVDAVTNETLTKVEGGYMWSFSSKFTLFAKPIENK